MKLTSLEVVAQNAQFETSIFFEDALGNIDTIIIGADTSANGENNPHLGMNLITEPWDSVFEVRVCDGFSYRSFNLGLTDSINLYYKLITDPPFVPSCGTVPYPVFFIYSKHHPVTVTWDTAFWSLNNTECYFNGSFFHTSDEILEPGWWTSFGEVPYGCLGLLENYPFDTTNHPYELTGITDSILGVGYRIIHGVHLVPTQLYNPLSPCPYVVSVPPILSYELSQLKIYPNPASESIQILLPDPIENISRLKLNITNQQGRPILHQEEFHENEFDINLNNITPGLYFLTVYDPGGTFFQTRKFVVIR